MREEMLKKLSESSGNVIGFKAIGKLTPSDFDSIKPKVKTLVEKESKIRLLFDMSEFKGETVKGWIADYKFGREIHGNVEKLAVIGDTTWEKLLMELAKLVYEPLDSKQRQNAKFFRPVDIKKHGHGLENDFF